MQYFIDIDYVFTFFLFTRLRPFCQELCVPDGKGRATLEDYVVSLPTSLMKQIAVRTTK